MEVRPVVAAIDIGDTYSGYAFSQRKDYESDPLQMRTNAAWAGSKDLYSHKTPTVVLLNPDGSLHSFGYEAEDHYAELALDDLHHDWRLFRNFKSVLLNPAVTTTVTVNDVSGRPAPAIDILSHSLSYLKNHLLTTLVKSGLTDRENLEGAIQWVLTIPATARDGARTLVKNAAIKCGLQEGHVLLPSETEASLLYCNLKLAKGGRSSLAQVGLGQRFLHMDLGGGTMHVAVFGIVNETTLEQLHQHGQKNKAACLLEDGLMNLFREVVGKQVLDEFKLEHRDDYTELVREFETKKRYKKQRDQVTMRVPISLSNVLQGVTGKTNAEVASESVYGSKVTWLKNDKLRLDADLVDKLFHEAAVEIVSEIKSRRQNTTNIHHVFLTGGLAENGLILSEVKALLQETDSTIAVQVPPEADTAVMRGAILYGHCPSSDQVSSTLDTSRPHHRPLTILVGKSEVATVPENRNTVLQELHLSNESQHRSLATPDGSPGNMAAPVAPRDRPPSAPRLRPDLKLRTSDLSSTTTITKTKTTTQMTAYTGTPSLRRPVSDVSVEDSRKSTTFTSTKSAQATDAPPLRRQASKTSMEAPRVSRTIDYGTQVKKAPQVHVRRRSVEGPRIPAGKKSKACTIL